MRKVLFILGKLQDPDLQWLLEAGSARAVERGQVLIHESRPVDSLFIVIDGEFAVEKGGAELARLDVGEVIGEMSFLDSRPPSATVTAVDAAVVFAIPKERLRSKLRTDSRFAARFYHAMCMFLADRLYQADARISSSGPGAPASGRGAADEISPDAMDTVFLAGVRFNWFLDRVRGL